MTKGEQEILMSIAQSLNSIAKSLETIAEYASGLKENKDYVLPISIGRISPAALDELSNVVNKESSFGLDPRNFSDDEN